MTSGIRAQLRAKDWGLQSSINFEFQFQQSLSDFEASFQQLQQESAQKHAAIMTLLKRLLPSEGKIEQPDYRSEAGGDILELEFITLTEKEVITVEPIELSNDEDFRNEREVGVKKIQVESVNMNNSKGYDKETMSAVETQDEGIPSFHPSEKKRIREGRNSLVNLSAMKMRKGIMSNNQTIAAVEASAEESPAFDFRFRCSISFSEWIYLLPVSNSWATPFEFDKARRKELERKEIRQLSPLTTSSQRRLTSIVACRIKETSRLKLSSSMVLRIDGIENKVRKNKEGTLGELKWDQKNISDKTSLGSEQRRSEMATRQRGRQRRTQKMPEADLLLSANVPLDEVFFQGVMCKINQTLQDFYFSWVPFCSKLWFTQGISTLASNKETLFSPPLRLWQPLTTRRGEKIFDLEISILAYRMELDSHWYREKKLGFSLECNHESRKMSFTSLGEFHRMVDHSLGTNEPLEWSLSKENYMGRRWIESVVWNANLDKGTCICFLLHRYLVSANLLKRNVESSMVADLPRIKRIKCQNIIFIFDPGG